MFEVRKDRLPQGRKKLHAERQAYLDLVAQGVGTAQACRVAGVNRRTGHRWRYGRVSQAGREAQPPARPSPSGRFLSVEDRILIADLRREGRSLRSIAAELGRDPSTVSREVRRNAHPRTGDYRPHAAQAQADARRPRPKISRLAANPKLRQAVQDGLDRRWSPEQIVRRLRQDFPDRPGMHVTHETIYQALYVQGRGELRRELTRALRTGRAVRRPHRQPGQRQSRFTTPMVMISDRPAEAADRAVPGHWEGDLIIGKDNASAIGTLVERATRYVLLVHLGRNRTAEAVRDALLATVATLPTHLKRSLTWDQGAEMALHHQFSTATGMPGTSATPTHPGNADPTRTPTACYASTSRKAPTSPSTPPNTSPPSPSNSTADHAKHSAGTPQPSASLNY